MTWGGNKAESQNGKKFASIFSVLLKWKKPYLCVWLTFQDDKKKERTVQRSLSTYLNRKHSPNSPESKDKPFRGNDSPHGVLGSRENGAK